MPMYYFVHNHCKNKKANAILETVNHSNGRHYSITTRNRNLFKVTHHDTQHGKLLLNNYCYNLGQSFSSSVKSAKSLNSFQSKRKEEFLKNYQ